MMDTPIQNVQLTVEQLHQIEETKKRLAILESEISNATKVLRSTKIEFETAVKDKTYQEELLATVTSQVKNKQLEMTELDEEILKKSANLNEIKTETESYKSEKEKSIMTLNDKEDSVSSREEKVTEKEKSVVKSKLIHEDIVKEFNQKVSQLKEVISRF